MKDGMTDVRHKKCKTGCDIRAKYEGYCFRCFEIFTFPNENISKHFKIREKHLTDFIKENYKGEPKIKVLTYTGLTTEFCEKVAVDFILRGLRNPADFEFEKAIAHTNRVLSQIETVFLLTAARTSYISSSIVRDVLRNGGDISRLVPDSVLKK